MKDLRTLVLTRCENSQTSVHALRPAMSSSGALVCPKLEELVIKGWGPLDIKDVVGTAAARALRGVKLKTVTIVIWDRNGHALPDVSELKEHVLRVETRRN